MKVCFWYSDKPRERLLAEAFLDGVKSNGDEVMKRPLQAETEVQQDVDVVCMVGVKSRKLIHAHWRAGVHSVYLDKGYVRHAASGGVRAWEYWRTAIDGHHPTEHLMTVARPGDRLDRLGLKLAPWRKRGDHVVFAGSSAKYHDFYSLPDPTTYARKVIKKIQKRSGRPVIYRPKPSWKEAVPIKGTEYSQDGSIGDVLDGAHALITHGSNACFEAVLMGVPSIILGGAVAKPISSTDLEDLEAPRLASDAERWQWLKNLAYCQWTMPEMRSGEAWAILRPQIFG